MHSQVTFLMGRSILMAALWLVINAARHRRQPFRKTSMLVALAYTIGVIVGAWLLHIPWSNSVLWFTLAANSMLLWRPFDLSLEFKIILAVTLGAMGLFLAYAYEVTGHVNPTDYWFRMGESSGALLAVLSIASSVETRERSTPDGAGGTDKRLPI